MTDETLSVLIVEDDPHVMLAASRRWRWKTSPAKGRSEEHTSELQSQR